MDFYSVIENRKSIKKFNSTPLNKEKIERIINAAMMAPSWKNKTSYKFILVENEVEKRKIGETIMNSNGDASKAVIGAPMCAVVVADPKESGVIDEREYYLVDSAVAMEHFILAATAEGYGTCWIGSFDEDKIRDILSIPLNFRVVAITPIGETDEKIEHYPKKDIKDHVFLNTWDSSFTENINKVLH